MNLRFYVRHERAGKVRRGVVFLKELVPRRAIAAIARVLYNEPYVALPMQAPRLGHAFRGRVRVARRRRVVVDRGTRVGGPGAIPALGKPGRVRSPSTTGAKPDQRDGGHARVSCRASAVECVVSRGVAIATLQPLYGNELAAALTHPVSAFIAEGSAVAVPSRHPVAP
jgi:hypothetical protein